jgi:endonuclease/exonuclease/phosphatase family metal-dependent hydrolase
MMPTTPDYAKDIVPRTPGSNVRVATLNCENLFARPIAMNLGDNTKGQPYIDACKELNTLFEKPAYSAADKARILAIMKKHKLDATRPQNRYLEFRKIRGQLLTRKGGAVSLVALGRSDWVGWVELKTEAIKDKAINNTARVIAAVNADVQVLCEIEDRPSLVKFHDAVLKPILLSSGRAGYPYLLLIDGNDPRGIDVAIMSRYPIFDLSTHVFDVPDASPIFSRDCAEFFVQVPGLPKPCIFMGNHFTSKGSDFTGLTRRLPQATQVRKIVDGRMKQGFTHIIVAGDLNDTPDSKGLAPLMTWGVLSDAVKQFANQIDPTGKRLGTYETGLQQIDYVMMSPALKAMAKGAGIERRGHYAPSTWKAFDTVSNARMQASDHHAVWLDLKV